MCRLLGLRPLRPALSGTFYANQVAHLSLPSSKGCALSSGSNFEVTLLGTGGFPSTNRNPCTTFAKLGETSMLFDAGDGCWKQLQKVKQPFGGFLGLFVSNLSPTAILGLPSLVHWLSSDLSPIDNASALNLFGPPGLFALVSSFFSTAYNPINRQIIVHEMHLDRTLPSTISANTFPWLKSSKFRVLSDPLPITNVSFVKLLSNRQGTWTAFANEKLIISAGLVESDQPCMGYVLRERDEAERKVCIVNHGRSPRNLLPIARGSDLLLHESSFGENDHETAANQRRSSPSTAIQSGELLNAKRLVINCLGDSIEERVSKDLLQLSPRPNHCIVGSDLMTIRIPLEGFSADLNDHINAYVAMLSPQDAILPAPAAQTSQPATQSKLLRLKKALNLEKRVLQTTLNESVVHHIEHKVSDSQSAMPFSAGSDAGDPQQSKMRPYIDDDKTSSEQSQKVNNAQTIRLSLEDLSRRLDIAPKVPSSGNHTSQRTSTSRRKRDSRSGQRQKDFSQTGHTL